MITEKVRFQFWSNKEREQLKEEFFVDSNKLAEASSELAKKETNDCVVRAFMCALNVSYEQAHNYIKTKMNRQNGKGTYVNAYAKNVIGATKNGLKISFIGTHPSKAFMKTSFGSSKVLVNKKYKKPTGYTLKSFMETHPVGRFVLIVQGHAVAVVNGVLFGNSDEKWDGLYRSVWVGFEMK
jgi:hypothetical protein